MLEPADPAGRDDLARLLERRRGPVGEVDHVHDAGGVGGIGHFPGEGIVGCERLLAEDVLSRGDELHRRRVVDAVGRDVRGRVELTPGDRFVEACKAVRDVVFGREGREPLRVGLDRRNDRDVRFGGEGEGMRLRHAARAKYEEAHEAHRNPASPAA